MRYEKHALCAALIALSSARIFGDVEVMASEEYVDNSVYAARTNLEEQIGIAYSSSTNYADVVKTNLEEQIGVAYSDSTNYTDSVKSNLYVYAGEMLNDMLVELGFAVSNLEEQIGIAYSSSTNYTDNVKTNLEEQIYRVGMDATNYTYSVKTNLEERIDRLGADSTNYIYSVKTNLEEQINRVGMDATNYTYSVKTNLEDQISHISPSSAQTNSIAMFVLEAQNDSIDFHGFELKCSTNNFNSAEFWSHSAYPADPSTDGMRMFITGMNTDRRKLTEIDGYNYLVYQAQKLVVVLVSIDECRRTDGKWLYEGNDDLMWVWIRVTANGREVAPGSDNELWRPVAPAKWLSRLPSWAR